MKITAEHAKFMTAVNAAAYDVSQWLKANGFDALTNDQRAALFATDAEGIADCDGMLDDLDARVGVPEADLMALRWAVHDFRAPTGKDAL